MEFLYFIAFISLPILVFLLIKFGGSKWSKSHVPYNIRRWISMDGFWEGFSSSDPASHKIGEFRERYRKKKEKK